MPWINEKKGKKMYKYIINGDNHIVKVEMDRLPSLKNNEALVEIHEVALCGSDYKLYQGKYNGPAQYPLIPGHEWAGKIVDIKSDTTHLRIGMKVTGDCSKWDSDCQFKSVCNVNKNTCPTIQKFGITQNGFLREYAIVPIHHLYTAPNDLPYELLALTEIFSVSNNAIKKSRILSELNATCSLSNNMPTTLILGLGAVGICIYLLLYYKYNMRNLIACDISEKRIHFIKELFPEIEIEDFGSIHYSNTYNSLLKQTPFVNIFEATGTDKGVNDALSLVNPNCNVTLVGMYPKTDYNITSVVLKSITLNGSIGGTGSFPEVIDFIYTHQNIVRKLITSHYTMNDDLHVAFDNRNNNFIKKLINIKGSF